MNIKSNGPDKFNDATEGKAVSVGTTKFNLYLIAAAITVVVFLFDLLQPLGVAAAVGYVALVLLGAWSSQRNDILILAVIGSAFTVLGYFLSSPGGEHMAVIINRGIALFMIWMTAMLILSRLNQEKSAQQANEKMKMAHNVLLNALESVPTMMALYDSEDRFVLCNQEYRKALHKVEDLLVPGTKLQEISFVGAQRGMVEGYQDRPEEWSKVRTERLHNPGPPILHQQEDGRWVLTADHRVADGSTFITRTDVTSVVEAENALHETESIFAKSQAYANIGTWEWDITDNTLNWSDQIASLFGFEPGAVATTFENFIAVIHPDDRERVAGAVQECVENGVEYDIDHRVVWADGTTHWLHEKGDVQRDHDGAPQKMAGIVWDITQRKNDEKSLRLALDQADIANSAKTDLMANMSHELRTPLNAIIGFSESMKDETFGSVGSDKNQEYLDDIYNSGLHLLELINDILDVAAIEAGALELYEEDVSLPNIVDASLRIIRPRADSGRLNVSSSIVPETPLIRADQRRVKQVFLNLLSNAVKFTPEEGEVSISSWLNENGSLSVAITDSGIGMDNEEIDKALSKFGQVDSGLDRKHEGTGLGLPLTRGLMEIHNGTMNIESQKGHGTKVTVTFPQERVAPNIR